MPSSSALILLRVYNSDDLHFRSGSGIYLQYFTCAHKSKKYRGNELNKLPREMLHKVLLSWIIILF